MDAAESQVSKTMPCAFQRRLSFWHFEIKKSEFLFYVVIWNLQCNQAWYSFSCFFPNFYLGIGPMYFLSEWLYHSYFLFWQSIVGCDDYTYIQFYSIISIHLWHTTLYGHIALKNFLPDSSNQGLRSCDKLITRNAYVISMVGAIKIDPWPWDYHISVPCKIVCMHKFNLGMNWK